MLRSKGARYNVSAGTRGTQIDVCMRLSALSQSALSALARRLCDTLGHSGLIVPQIVDEKVGGVFIGVLVQPVPSLLNKPGHACNDT